MSTYDYEGLAMKLKGKDRPSRLVRLSAAEMAEVGYGDVGRFPAADIYAASAVTITSPAAESVDGDKPHS
jgi:hypothetical protein